MSKFKFFEPSSWATSFKNMNASDPFTGKPIAQGEISAQVDSYGKEKTDPFTGKPITQGEISAQVDSFGEDDDPFVDEPDQGRPLQQTQMVNPDRQAELKKAKERSNIQKSEPKSGLSAGAAGRGITTSGLKTYGNLSGSGGFGKQTKVNPARR